MHKSESLFVVAYCSSCMSNRHGHNVMYGQVCFCKYISGCKTGPSENTVQYLTYFDKYPKTQ